MAKLALMLGVTATAIVTPALAQAASPSTGTLQVTMTVQAECKLQSSAAPLAFGTHGVIDQVVDAQTSLGVQCTNSTPFNVALGAGGGAGATIAARVMSGANSAAVTYGVYRDAARSQLWGVTASTDTLASTGTGALQTFQVYGRVPVQATPAAGNYTDTLAVTVTY